MLIDGRFFILDILRSLVSQQGTFFFHAVWVSGRLSAVKSSSAAADVRITRSDVTAAAHP
jgi:hypothetical protein